MSEAIPSPTTEDPPSLTNGEAIFSNSKDNTINDVAGEIQEVVVTKNNARKGVEDGINKGETDADVNMVEFDHAKEGNLSCAILIYKEDACPKKVEVMSEDGQVVATYGEHINMVEAKAVTRDAEVVENENKEVNEGNTKQKENIQIEDQTLGEVDDSSQKRYKEGMTEDGKGANTEEDMDIKLNDTKIAARETEVKENKKREEMEDKAEDEQDVTDTQAEDVKMVGSEVACQKEDWGKHNEEAKGEEIMMTEADSVSPNEMVQEKRKKKPYEDKTVENTINDQTGDVLIVSNEDACQKEDKIGKTDHYQDMHAIENEDLNMVDVRANEINYDAKGIGKKKGTEDVTEKKQTENNMDTICIEKEDGDKMDPKDEDKKELDKIEEIGGEKAPCGNLVFENKEEDALCKKGASEKKEEEKVGGKGAFEKDGEEKTMDLLSNYSFDRPMRGRRIVERFVEVMEKGSGDSSVVEKGHGTPLKNIPSVAYRIKRKKPDELKILHHLLFGRRGKAADIKKSILQFSGFVCHENDGILRAKTKGKLESRSKDTLSDLCGLLSIPVSKANSRKEEIVAKLLDFIAKPEAMDDSTLFDEKESNSRKRKRDGERGTKNLEGAHKRSRKMAKKNKGKPADSRKSFPGKDDLQKTIVRILKKVDFEMTTYGDILQKLDGHYKMDLSSSKDAIKRMIKDEVIKSAPESSDD